MSPEALDGWRAYVSQDPYMGVFGLSRVILYRFVGVDRVELVSGFTAAGEAILEIRDRTENTAEPTLGQSGFAVPTAALHALAETIKPGPSQGEIARLEEALKVERARVDSALEAGQSLPYRFMPGGAS